MNGNNVPDDLVIQCEKLTACARPPYTLNKRVIRLPVQPQLGDDCGACVNHIALNLALHGREFVADTRSIAFDTVSMRVSQLKAIWDHILLPCFELPVVTPSAMAALKRQQNSPEV